MNETKNPSSIMNSLHILSLARSKLVSDFVEKEHDIYLPMFKYENDPELMKLAIENYFTSWANIHFKLWDKHHRDQAPELFHETIKSLLIKVCDFGEINSHNQQFYSKLISSKINLINTIIHSSERDNEKYNSLLLEYEKDKVLFEREINRLKETK